MATKEVASAERQAEARKLFEQATGTGASQGNPPDRSRWGSLWRFQKEAKKGWDVLGFTTREVERIKTNKPDWV